MDKPKKLILDYSKWRCGEDGNYSLGEGDTKLLNAKGFMCCLGQWGLQCGIPEEDMLGNEEPIECYTKVPLFEGDGRNLVIDAIDINDNSKTTTEEKIELLKERLKQEGIELEVINKPV